MQKVVLHIIDYLGVGGAETLLVKANIQLPDFKHIIVYLKPPNEFQKEVKHLPVICLNYTGIRSLLRCVRELRGIMAKYQVDIVHSHLYFSMIIARLALTNKVQLISSYHSLLYDPKNRAQYSVKLLWLDQLTYRKKHHLVFVSKTVRNLVSSKVGVIKNYSIIYNFIDPVYFNTARTESKDSKFRVIMVGNLRQEKNQIQALEALAMLKDTGITIDIYGDGAERKYLERRIDQLGLQSQVHLRGLVDDTSTVLSKYDLFLSTSLFEGFGIALAEALAIGLPCIVSDIPAHREVSGSSAVLFNSSSASDLSIKLAEMRTSTTSLQELSKLGKETAIQFTKKAYLEKLMILYNKLTEAK
ncbi:MAG: glycosyltransferase involved in cell wall biosynthesis [Cyclobacteriaceae bacterium]|jgi:glycosyltransferase involved in cell wall biosynthesis